MSQLKEMRERRNAAAKAARDLMSATKDKAWTSENQSKYDELTGQITDLDGRIEREQNMLDIEAEKKFDNEMDDISRKSKHKTIDALSERGITDAWIRNGREGLSAEQNARFQNTLSTTTGSQGQYTVQSEVAKSLIDKMKDYSGMRQVSTIIQTTQGNPLSYPTSDGTSEEGEIVAQNAAASSADPTFGTAALTAYKYGSKIIAVPIELLMDSQVDVEALVMKRAAQRIGRITNKHFTIGTNSSQPNGVTVAASIGKTGLTGQTTSIIYDDFVDLMESIDQAYLDEGNAKWMFSQTLRAVIRKLKDSQNRPIWTPGYELGITAKLPELLLGQPVQINNHMPVPAADAVSLAFGDFTKYMIRDVLQVSLFRFTDSVYVSNGQIGFLAWARCGGNLMDTNAVKTYAHSHT